MILNNQKSALSSLQSFVSSDRHSILICGPTGSGKTFVAQTFANMIGAYDFIQIKSTVQDIRSASDEISRIESKVLLCIENLDAGVFGAASALLKLLEEPKANAYIVVTCNNINRLPDTIVSRSAVVDVGYPTRLDIDEYGSAMNLSRYTELQNNYKAILECATSYSDVNTLLNMSNDELSHFNEIDNLLRFKDNVSSIVWGLTHLSSGTECDAKLVVKYILHRAKHDAHIQSACISALSDIELNRIGVSAVLSKFVIECKYGE